MTLARLLTTFRAMTEDLSERTREIFRKIVENYLATGDPVGSRTLSRQLGIALSPASIRNTMADLEEAGLLYSPHTSAGRLPTQAGLRLFVDGLLELGNLAESDRTAIKNQCGAAGASYDAVLEQATSMLSGLSHCAGLVVAPKLKSELRHIEFVGLSPGKALVVIVTVGGQVENRVIDVPLDMLPSTLVFAANYLNARLTGRTLDEARHEIQAELDRHQAELDALTTQVVEAGLAVWAGGEEHQETLIVRGQSNLLDGADGAGNLERIRKLLDDLENKKEFVHLLDLTRSADGVRIFIGSENNLFSLSGSSLIVAPFGNAEKNILGVVGVIGPTRVNYARVIPMVDYTAKVMGKFLSWDNENEHSGYAGRRTEFARN